MLLLQCVQRMVLTLAERSEISKKNEIYRMESRILGYDMVVEDRTTRCQVSFNFKFCLFLSIYYI
jgi:hypothetical protein